MTANTTETTTVASRLESIRTTTGNVADAFNAGGRAYFNGLNEMSRSLFGFGRQFANEAVEHAKATVRAKSVREIAQLQTAYAQHRVKTFAAQTKEFTDLAQVKAEEVIAPLAQLANGEATPAKRKAA